MVATGNGTRVVFQESIPPIRRILVTPPIGNVVGGWRRDTSPTDGGPGGGNEGYVDKRKFTYPMSQSKVWLVSTWEERTHHRRTAATGGGDGIGKTGNWRT